ncbi:NAD(P)H-binding protein [Mesorhizobium cantuariense]|uniref:NAD(P)H-binding protein n=1 Tax=Mesorhizobium cantuariense TaxID=1300275 RepID=A0ABV7MPL6_9HYPH
MNINQGLPLRRRPAFRGSYDARFRNDNIPTAQPKILVLGATGGTGRLIVAQALAREYDVTVLVRSPEKASDLKGAKLIVGDAATRKSCAKRSTALRSSLDHFDAQRRCTVTPLFG